MKSFIINVVCPAFGVSLLVFSVLYGLLSIRPKSTKTPIEFPDEGKYRIVLVEDGYYEVEKNYNPNGWLSVSHKYRTIDEARRACDFVKETFRNRELVVEKPLKRTVVQNCD